MSLNWNAEKMGVNLPVVVGNDHPLSLGWQVILVTNHPLVKDESKASTEQVTDLLDGQSYSGCHATWDKHRRAVLFINGFEAGDPIPLGRVIELIVHEVSHLVDGFFERACVSVVDTEVRAYYNDWMVGKVLHHFPTLWNEVSAKPELPE